MRKVVLSTLVIATMTALAGCGSGTSDPYDPAIRAMTASNACGTAGANDINQCKGHPRSSN